ncbi:MAG: phosphoenolpyruvate synthase [Patescibacteria group bacterium]
MPNLPLKDKKILWFSEIRKEDIPLVGGKGANLGELASIKAPVPPGFCVTAKAYYDFLDSGSLREKIKTTLSDLDTNDNHRLTEAATKLHTAILRAALDPLLVAEISKAYLKLSGTHDVFVAVRSSATAEDLPEASFAGQQESYLNVKGAEAVITAVHKCWASLFSPRAIFYRAHGGFDHLKVGICAVVQLMVESEVSGIMFTVDPMTNDRNKIAIEAAFGLGQPIVSGEITPDQYLIDKADMKILSKKIVGQTWQFTRSGRLNVSKEYQKKQKLPDKEILSLAEMGRMVEAHYNFPQDMEWAFENKKLWLVQARPVTTLNTKSMNTKEEDIDEKPLLEGIGAAPGIVTGPVRLINSPKEIGAVLAGEILVTKMTNPDFVPAMKKVVAVVTDEGGRTSHAAIVSRELGITCVVGTEHATKMLKTGEIIMVDGGAGKIYLGAVGITIPAGSTQQDVLTKTATKLYVNLAEPEAAEKVAALHVDGIGLLRAEFMMAEIGRHPKSFIEANEQELFISKLTEGLLTFARAFKPRPIIYRTSDFKTNEYRGLLGGDKFEAEESNPLIGYRGALRYVTDPEVFKMELAAVLRVRNKYHCKNVHVMLPFVRTVEELQITKNIISAEGLHRGGGFRLYLMVEIPANVILLEEFAKVGIDGISIGSNDLAMLVLGADRDNSRLSKAYNEMNPAVLKFIEEAVKKAKKLGLTSSICGQAPSTYPEMAKKLVSWGISSVSVNPDVIGVTRNNIAVAEAELCQK